MPLAGENELSAISKDPQALIRIPVGVASPLWGLFAGAAMTGAAWWWMTRWTRPANLEAVFGAAEAATKETIAEVEALTAPVVEAASEAMEAVIEDITSVQVAEALIDAAPEAVGGESAPISPVLESLAPEVVEPVIEPAPVEAAPEAVEIAPEALAEVSPESKPAPKPKKAVAPKAD